MEHWFEEIADHAGTAYLRYSFTKGTRQEVDFLVGALGLGEGSRVLDVGCGPGRHAHAFAERGIEVHGIDISHRFVELAREGARDVSEADGVATATFERLDARALAFDGEFDAAISLCQGAFGLLGDPGTSPGSTGDAQVLDGMRRAVRVGSGLVAVSAFSAYFQLRWLEDTDAFDADRGVNVERTSVKDEEGRDAEFTLETTCFTPRELRLLADRAGLRVRDLWSVTPGAYRSVPPSIDTPEFLLIASRPA